MTLFRTFSVGLALALAAPFAAQAAARDSAPFSIAPAQGERGIILVIDSAEACAADSALAQAALAAQAGRRVGIVVSGGAACGAARAVMAGSAPDLAFASRAEYLGAGAEPNAFLAHNRVRGLYVWSLDAYRRLALDASRQVLGLFAEESSAPMIAAALDRLARDGGGYFLLVQADALDAAALDALAAAKRRGASVIAPDLALEAALPLP